MKTRIVYKTEIPNQYKTIADTVVEMAEVWLCKRYQKTRDIFNGFELVLSCTSGRNWYYPLTKSALIRISSTRLYLYDIKDAGKTTPPEGLPVGVGVYLSSSFIHEATHFLQNIFNRDYSELETTVNQIDFIKEVSPLTFKLLEKSKGDTVEAFIKNE